jgi:hypothetical protein
VILGVNAVLIAAGLENLEKDHANYAEGN